MNAILNQTPQELEIAHLTEMNRRLVSQLETLMKENITWRRETTPSAIRQYAREQCQQELADVNKLVSDATKILEALMSESERLRKLVNGAVA